MTLSLFSKFKKSGEDGGGGGGAPTRDPKKAKRFFEHAQAVADSRNYDYAIECYINGLRHDPESLQHHEALRDVALRRKVNGGKGPSFKEKTFTHSGGKTPLEKMLNAEFLWSKDPFDAQAVLNAMEGAVKADLPEVAYWFGGFVLENARQVSKPAGILKKSRDLFAEIGAYDRAVEACKGMLTLNPNNANLYNDLKNLEAELTMMEGRYGEEGGSFRSAVKDADKQRALEQEDQVARTETAQEETIARARAAYEENPEDMDLLGKLVRVLAQKETEEAENEAIDFLKKAHEQTKQYRYRMQIGDLRMKQHTRRVRKIRQALAKADEEKKAKLQEQLKQAATEQVKLELQEFTDRAKNYPTDMGIRYNLGRRQLAVGDLDAAIGSFQEAQSDPKNRSWALRYLGEAFARKEWYDEAVDTFRRGIEVHPYSDDRLALELRYELMKVLVYKAERDDDLESAQEASKIASQIAQADINYKDIRDRVNHVRELVNRLKKVEK